MKDADVDGRADIYCLGVTLYHLLTGKMPVEGTSALEVLMKIRQTPPEKARKFQPSIPESFDLIVLKMLAKQPTDRFQSADELLTALEKIAQQ